MTIFPSIDIYEGKAVRLVRGDYEQMTVYSDDPPAMAKKFKEAGAEAIHIVDLEAARDGKPANYDLIKRIVMESEIETIQVGGGIRTMEIIKRYLDIGVSRVIIGTAAVSVPGFLAEAVRSFAAAIAVSADIKDGFVAVKGWTELSNLDILSFCKAVEDSAVGTLICTDVSKDGLLSGTNMELYQTLREKMRIKLIASGGITTLEEIITLSRIGMDGAIIGKAIYTGNIKLEDAILRGTE